MFIATVCYLRDNDRTLLLHRTKKKEDATKGTFIGIGGKIEGKESLEACVRREFTEETGLILLDPRFQGMALFKNGDESTWLVAVYVATHYTGTLHPTREGELQWVDNERIPQLNLLEGDRIFLPYLFKPEIFAATFWYTIEGERKTLRGHEIYTIAPPQG